jgi:DNA polymerase
MTGDRARAARELLDFYRDAGVDALVGESPVNRLSDDSPPATEDDGPAAAASARRPPVPAAALAAAPPAPAPPLAAEEAVAAARNAARSAGSLEELRARRPVATRTCRGGRSSAARASFSIG